MKQFFQASGFEELAKIDQFLAFLISTQSVNVALFARNVEWDFSCDFMTPCYSPRSSYTCFSRKYESGTEYIWWDRFRDLYFNCSAK